MNILELVGFLVLCALGIVAILWLIGILEIDAGVSINKDDNA